MPTIIARYHPSEAKEETTGSLMPGTTEFLTQKGGYTPSLAKAEHFDLYLDAHIKAKALTAATATYHYARVVNSVELEAKQLKFQI